MEATAALTGFLLGTTVTMFLLWVTLAVKKRQLDRQFEAEAAKYAKAFETYGKNLMETRELAETKLREHERRQEPRVFYPLDFVTVQISDEEHNYRELEGMVLEAGTHAKYRVLVGGHEMVLPGIFLVPSAKPKDNNSGPGTEEAESNY